MPASNENRSGVLQWVIVLVVGALVVTLVLGLNLITRLSDGQKVLNAAKPAYSSQRLATDVTGIKIISKDVNMANPIVTAQGGGAAEVPAIVAYVAKAHHLSAAQTLALMQKNFPHTTALLLAIPLSSVSAELPGLEAFLEKTLKVTPPQLVAALKTNFPALYAAIANLPTVTNGWNSIPNLGGLTRFDGTPVTTVPQLRTYFASDLIPAVAAQKPNYDSLNSKTSVNWIAPLLLILGSVVILFAAVMIARNLSGVSRGEARATAIVVPVVGVVVVALVLVIALIPRVSNGQKLLDGLKPAFTAQRVTGDRGGISMVSAIVNTEDPIMTAAGGGAVEVPKLIAFVSSKTGLSEKAVLAALQKSFPHTTALLEAIPLSSVSAELPRLVAFLGPAALPAIPALLPTVLNAPAVTAGWNNVPGTAASTNFQGAPIRTVPEVRTYFSQNVIPILETQRHNYETLISTSKINFLGPLVLIIGLVVIAFGLLMVRLAQPGRPAPRADRPGMRTPAPTG
jgi:hypothetical protein